MRINFLWMSGETCYYSIRFGWIDKCVCCVEVLPIMDKKTVNFGEEAIDGVQGNIGNRNGSRYGIIPSMDRVLG
jgi:hypothetical protein